MPTSTTRKSRLKSAILAGGVIIALAMSVAPADAQERSYDMPERPLSEALREYGRVTGRQIIFTEDLVRGKRAPRLRGSFTPTEALARLLAESGLTIETTPAGAIMVVRRQADSSSAQERRDTGQEDTSEKDIVVTGSRIRGTGASAGTDVKIITREDIDRSGFGTTQQVLQSLPQNFRAGANEDTRFGNESFSNFTEASTVNLRGLGSASTLLLVNGRRVPIAGADANFFDVSGIPATAIERIEVLPDGASAIYGADAIAGVVNIILRRDYEGAETRLRYGSVTDGGLHEYQFGQTFGAKWATGSALISYEFYKRDGLGSEERSFAASSDLTPFGGTNWGNSFSNPANILSPLTFAPAYAIPPGQDGRSLTPADLLPGIVNIANTNEGRDLLADQKRHSVFAAANQALTDAIRLFAEGRFSKRDFRSRQGAPTSFLLVPASNPFFVDPFGGQPFLFLTYSFLDDLGPLIAEGSVKSYSGVVGVTADIGGDWRIQAYGSYSQEDSRQTLFNNINQTALAAALADPDPATAFNPFGDGSNTNPATIEMIRTSTDFSRKSTVRSANLVADGTLFDLPGGAVKLAVGADYRTEEFGTSATSFDRRVAALFGEVRVPIVGDGNPLPFIRRLTLSLSARVEDYNDVGTTANPKAGISWQPIEDLTLRGTYGTSFRAPNLTDLDESQNQAGLAALPDPRSPTGSSIILVQTGKNASLKNETATTWSLGFDLNPAAIPRLRFSATYFDIEFKDRITSPRNILGILPQEDRFASLVIRNPTIEQIRAICNSPPFTRFGDPATCETVPIAAIIDARLRNNAVTQVRGIDFDVNYALDAGKVGRFDLRFNGSYLIDFKQADTPAAPVVEFVDTINNPADLRMRNSLTWTSPTGLSATAFLNYVDGYTNNLKVPSERVESWTTIDLQLSYDTGNNGPGWLKNTNFAVSVLNVFDSKPPFVDNPQGVGYDPENADPLGRFISFTLTKRW